MYTSCFGTVAIDGTLVKITAKLELTIRAITFDNLKTKK